jgi:hypothetical protein
MFANACIFFGYDNFHSLETMNPKIIYEYCSQCVPNKFPSYFHQVFLTSCQCAPKDIPNIYSILFGHGSIAMHISCKRGAKGKHEKTHFYFGEESFYVGVLHVSKIFVNILGQSNCSFKKFKKNLGRIPSLINRIMNEQVPPL